MNTDGLTSGVKKALKELKEDFPMGEILVVGCNYHTKWQSDKSMRFVLSELKQGKARLTTRNTKKNFWTDSKDLVFILTGHNIRKAQNFRLAKRLDEMDASVFGEKADAEFF